MMSEWKDRKAAGFKWPRSMRPRPIRDAVTGVQLDSIRRRIYRYVKGLQKLIAAQGYDMPPCQMCGDWWGMNPEGAAPSEYLTHLEEHFFRKEYPAQLFAKGFVMGIPPTDIEDATIRSIELGLRRVLYQAYGFNQARWPVTRINRFDKASKRRNGAEN